MDGHEKSIGLLKESSANWFIFSTRLSNFEHVLQVDVPGLEFTQNTAESFVGLGLNFAVH